MVESGEARKGAVVRLTFDAGGTPGWRREPGHPTWKRGPSTTEATTAQLKRPVFPDVVNFSLWLRKEGYAPKTILDRTKSIKRIAKLGTLSDAETVKASDIVLKPGELCCGRFHA